MNKTRLITLFLMSFFVSSIFYSADLVEQTEEEKIIEILNYGLENEIVDLISNMKSKSKTEYNKQLEVLFYSTRNNSIKEAILSFYIVQKNPAFVEWSISVLDDPYEYSKATVLSVFSYLIMLEVKEAAPQVRKILESENPDYRDKAILLLGKIGTSSDSDFLFEYLESEISGDEKERLVIRQNIMNSLGEMRAENSWNRLSEIAQDQDENIVIRSTAAVALSKMKKSDAIPILLKLLEEKDPLLRVAAVQGLSEFSSPEVTSAILESFKDSYYKVRLEAINSAEKLKLNEAAPFLLYRAKTDPVESIKFRSFEVLAILNDSDGTKWLVEQFNLEKNSDKVRIKAFSVLLEHNIEIIKTSFYVVIKSVLQDEKKKNLRYELGKLISNSKEDFSSSVAESFLLHSDTLTRSIGLDIYEKKKYPELLAIVEKIAADEKQGALQRRAKKIIDAN
ncbi:MAG TPA: HEAT repeat domain-containing protein [Treponemataceae bacterium]|nr:HEAT repeat domain-containing protein [Treponemataceae bacterium]